jgi:hypothetical protein
MYIGRGVITGLLPSADMIEKRRAMLCCLYGTIRLQARLLTAVQRDGVLGVGLLCCASRCLNQTAEFSQMRKALCKNCSDWYGLAS